MRLVKLLVFYVFIGIYQSVLAIKGLGKPKLTRTVDQPARGVLKNINSKQQSKFLKNTA
ncbi:MAG: hypothetical protein WBA16_01815 [Nonlabens sp.]